MLPMRPSALLLTVMFLVTPSTAFARNDLLEMSVKTAVQGERGQAKLLDVPVYMKGQSHPRVLKSYGEFSSNRRTNAFMRADDVACEIAFLSALISLQKRAQAEGGNAVVDIVSITRNENLSSASKYRCAAGNTVANVALSGRVVKIKR